MVNLMSRSRSLISLLRQSGSAFPVVAGDGFTILSKRPTSMAAGLAVFNSSLALGPVLNSSGIALSSSSHMSFSARGIATTLLASSEKENTRKHSSTTEQNLVAADEEFSAITDKIPQRPVSIAEGTSYTVVIIAAIGFAAAVLYAALNELIFSPKEYQCYSHTLNRIKDDPRVTIRLGTPISAYGSESQNRAARQRIPHRLYNDAEGREHIQLQFHMRGPSGRATVNADMYQEGSQWRYHFLYLNFDSPLRQQVVVVRPGQPDDY